MKKLTINMIARGNLRRNRRQYVALTAGIVLAIFFASFMLLFSYSVSVSQEEILESRVGSQDAIVMNCGDAPLDQFVEDGYWETYVVASALGFVPTDDSNTGFTIAAYDQTAKELINWEIVEGRMPETAGEIALEQTAYSMLHTDAQVGDTITLPVRLAMGDSFEQEAGQKTYTLTGILSDHQVYAEQVYLVTPTTYAFAAGVLSEEEQIDIGGKSLVNCYVNYSSRYISQEETMEQAMYDALGVYTSSFFVLTKETTRSLLGDSNAQSLAKSGTWIAFVLVLASCLGIASAFSANLQQRQKQSGLLRAVAATRRQIRQIYGREAILIALLSIPPSVLLSCLVVWGITRLMGPGFHLVIHLPVLIAVVLISFACILISSQAPLWKASRIPPMRALRDASLTQRLHKQNMRTKKQYTVASHLARRNRKLYRSNLISISLLAAGSIVVLSVLLVTGNLAIPTASTYTYDFSLSNGSLQTDQGGMNYDFYASAIPQQDLNTVENLSSVDSVDAIEKSTINVFPDFITDYMLLDGVNGNLNYLTEENEWFEQLKQMYGYQDDYYNTLIAGMTDGLLTALSDYVIEGEINLDKLDAGEEVLVFAPSYIACAEGSDDLQLTDRNYTDTAGTEWTVRYFSENPLEMTDALYTADQVYENDMFHAGDELPLSVLYTGAADVNPLDLEGQFGREDTTVTIGAVIDANSILSVDMEAGAIITSISGMQALGYPLRYNNIYVSLSANTSIEMEEYLEEHIQSIAASSDGTTFANHLAIARAERNQVAANTVASLSIIILLFAICMSMISNTISARILASRRSIGMLRAVGASEREIVSSYLLQLAPPLLGGIAFGMIASVIAAYSLQYLTAVNEELANTLWLSDVIPVWQPLLFALVLLQAGCLTARRKVRAVLKSSIVDNIREL